MKPVFPILGLLLTVLAGGLAGGAGHAQTPPTPGPAAGPPPARYGLGGKLSLPPPGDWQTSGPAAGGSAGAPRLPVAVPGFGPDVDIAGGNETVIAANPANPLNFLAGANSTGRFTTTDGGVTWNTGYLAGGGDPAAAFDAAGRAYFAELGNTGGCPDSPYFYRSTDGGFTFTGPMLPLSDPAPATHFFDKEWLAVDTGAGSPHRGRIYYTATNFHTPPGCDINHYLDSRVELAYSDDQGATWSTPADINDASHNQDQFTNPVVAADGTLYVGYQYQNCTYSCDGVPAYQMLARSTDGGVSFSPSITITGQPISYTGASVSGYQYLYASNTNIGFRHNDQAVLGVSPTAPNQVYALWSDGRFESPFVYQGVTGRHGDIVFTRSSDGGATWTAPIKINDDSLPGKDQFFPWLAVGADGVIHAAWSDRRDAPVDGFAYREYYSQSTDGGLTWSPNLAVADAGSIPSSFIGDYNGLAVNRDNTRVLPIWTDMRQGQQAYTDPGLLVAGTPTPTPAGPPPSATAPAATATPCALHFSDVGPADYFYTPVQYLACHGVISGYADGTYRPAANTTRAQQVKIVILGFNTPLATPTAGGYTFADVPPTHPFWTVIETAAARNVVGGYTCGGPGEPCDAAARPYFRPYAAVTRGQLAKIVVGAAGWALQNPGSATFADVVPNTAFYPFVETASCHGVVSGYSCGGPGEPCNGGNAPYYRPAAPATRGQIAKIVYNAILGAATCAPFGPN